MVTNLPYITLKTAIGNFPFLIDTGANVNLINPRLAYQYKFAKPYNFEAYNISSANGKFNVSSAIDINFFLPAIDYTDRFILHNFHIFFHGIIGTGILNALGAKIDLENKTLMLQYNNQQVTMPLEFYTPQQNNTNIVGLMHNENNFVDEPSTNIETHNKFEQETTNELPYTFRTSHLSSTEKSKLLQVLQSNVSAFHSPDAKLTCSTVVECAINTTDDIPIHQKVYPYPAAYTDEVNKQINKLLRDGIIKPSRSAWTSPVWIVPKKTDASGEKKFRMVIDYRKLNEKTISDRYPMPEINYVIDQLKGQKFFTTLDLASGFHQIKMKDNDIEKTAFSINNGKFEFTRMPFGLKNGPAIFQRAIDDVLRDYIGKICYVYIDDVIIFGKTLEEALHNLDLVLKALNKANLKIQLDKSEFLHHEIEFLGYVISREGINPNFKKVEAVTNYPQPKTIKELRSFLGMTGYYRRFVRDFAKIAKPLTNLLRGETVTSNKKINLDDKENRCFEKLKQVLASSDVLIYPDFSKPFVLTTDASDFAIGAVLSQGEIGKDRPIHFASRTLSQSEEKYSVPEKEMLAIFWALKTFRNYLYGTKFKIFTDHQPLTFALSPKNTNAKLKNMKAYLEEHDYEIMYKPGKSNLVADALSRVVYTSSDSQHSTQEEEEGEEQEEEDNDDLYIVSTDAPLNGFRHQVIIKNSNKDDVTIEHPFPGYIRKTVYIKNINDFSLLQVLRTHFDPARLNGLLADENLIEKIQEIYKTHFGHNKLLRIRFTKKLLEDIQDENNQLDVIRKEHYRAHRGFQENKLQILRNFYFPKLNGKVCEFVRNCQLCHLNKYDRKPIHYPLQETPIPNAPFQIAHIDIMFIEKLQYLTYIDKFSKFAQAVLLQSRAAVDIVPAVKEVLQRYRLPETLVMDHEKSFMIGDLAVFYRENGITPYIVATGRSEMNGVVERFHSTLQEIYRITKAEYPEKSPEEIVNMSVIKYNSTIHSCTKFTPYEIIIPSSRSSEVIESVYSNLQKKQHKDLEYHNKNLAHRHIEENKDVYEKTRRRLKTVPRYKKITVKEVKNSTIITSDNRQVHKNDIKIRY
uniref:RNA-directed DNA polymerase n=1 Tax=Chibugado virus TaxID=2689361 RepID=A0A6B9KG65_9VIRU|nr:polyprotein [Chibugado virus]